MDYRHILGILSLIFLSSCQVDPLPEFLLQSQSESQLFVEEEPLLENPTKPVEIETSTIPDQYIIVFVNEAEEETGRIASSALQSRGINDTQAKAFYEAENKKAVERSIEFLAEHGIAPEALVRAYGNALHGMTAKLTQAELAKLQRDDRVDFIEEDKMIAMGDMGPEIRTPFKPSDIFMSNYEIQPYGVSRVGGSRNFEGNTAINDKWAWIVDTGVESGHNELNMLDEYAMNFSASSDLGDAYGHGTHVAGIIGARDNGQGVVGVAAGAYMVNVKVLDNDGEGNYSDIVAALDYIKYMAIPGDVVNMSIGGPSSSCVDYATKRLGMRGIKVVVAAGNESDHVSNYSPARVSHSNIYVVGAINFWNQYSSFSNYGSNVDYAGPGVAILSTFGANQYAFMSGTSMAAPHVAGALLASGYNTYNSGNSSNDQEGRRLPLISY